MKYFIAVVLTMFLASCAHHHKSPEHHHHVSDKECDYELHHDNLEGEGIKEYKVEHSGKSYYFFSLDKMNEFKKEIESEKTNVSNNNISNRREF